MEPDVIAPAAERTLQLPQPHRLDSDLSCSRWPRASSGGHPLVELDGLLREGKQWLPLSGSRRYVYYWIPVGVLRHENDVLPSQASASDP